MSRGLSPLERRALLALVSPIRDREPDRDFWAGTNVPLSALYESLHVVQPDKSYELQLKYQRQAIRRALGRLHEQGWIEALALAWAYVRDGDVIEWHGGGRRRPSGSAWAARYGDKTPNWKPSRSATEASPWRSRSNVKHWADQHDHHRPPRSQSARRLRR